MIKIENYPNAYKEVYVILNNMKNEDIKSIPQTFIDMIKNNMNNNYKFVLEPDTDIEEKPLLKETKVILAYLYLNYWGTDEERERIKKKFRNDIIKEEQAKAKIKYNDIFEKPKQANPPTNITTNETTEALIEYKKPNIFLRVLNKIKKIFAKQK